MIFDNKVVEAFKSMGINKHCQELINAYREEIYNRKVDNVRQFFLDNVDLSKGIFEAFVDINHFTSFVRANYFKVDKLKLVDEKHGSFKGGGDFIIYEFENENKNLYNGVHFEAKLYKIRILFDKCIISVHSFKNSLSHRDYNKPSVVRYNKTNGSIYLEQWVTEGVFEKQNITIST